MNSRGTAANDERASSAERAVDKVPTAKTRLDTESGGLDHASSTFSDDTVEGGSSSDDSGTSSAGTALTQRAVPSLANGLIFVDTEKGFESFAHIQSTGWVNLLADGLHNFVDGIVIGSTYSFDFSAGVGTTVAILIHEVPAELGDFAVLRHSGFSFWGAFAVNMLSGVTALLGALMGLAIGTNLAALNVWILGFVAGAFIYIALGALVPELMKEKTGISTIIQSVFIVLGMVIMILITLLESALE